MASSSSMTCFADANARITQEAKRQLQPPPHQQARGSGMLEGLK
jgi:hypothetical protein